MAIVQGFTVLLIFQLIGEVLSVALALAIPGPVLGMLVLAISLLAYRKVPAAVDEASSGLLRHLSLLFVPAGVGVMVHFERLGEAWFALVIALMLSTLVTLVATAWLMQLIINWRGAQSD
ncbi:MAG: CidA/LrgA family protein [Granulosicoccaceae bacterium]